MKGQLLSFPSSTEGRLAQIHGTPLLLLDCQRLRQQYRALAQALPGVDLHYALKALPEQAVVNTLAPLGAGFDIASSGELDLLRQAHVKPRRVIHSHPVKKPREISEALRFGCTSFVFDNRVELEKFQRYRHRIGLVLRIGFRSPSASVDLSRKFGCSLGEVPNLLRQAHDLGLRVKGLAFHVGSQCATPDAHVHAIRETLRLVRELKASGMARIGLLDIGGGFPVDYGGGVPDIAGFCAPIRAALAEAPAHLRLIAEPGRVLVAPAVRGLFSVVGCARREGRPWYYLDDGVYGSFSGRVFEGARYRLRSLRQGPLTASVLAGPTCDSIDVIAEGVMLPELQVGDLLVADMLGAYSAASATNFNSLPKTPLLPLDDAKENSVVL